MKYWYVFREYKAVLMTQFTRGLEKVLEIGCGPKYYMRFCQSKMYVGVDLMNKPDIIASAMHLPFRDGCFNGIIMFDVLEHIKDIDKALSECKRILKRGGRLLILSPNTLGFGLYDSFADPAHIHHFTWYTIKKILSENGFKINETIPLHLHITWPLRLISKKVFQAIQQSICVICEK